MASVGVTAGATTAASPLRVLSTAPASINAPAATSLRAATVVGIMVHPPAGQTIERPTRLTPSSDIRVVRWRVRDGRVLAILLKNRRNRRCRRLATIERRGASD